MPQSTFVAATGRVLAVAACLAAAPPVWAQVSVPGQMTSGPSGPRTPGQSAVNVSIGVDGGYDDSRDIEFPPSGFTAGFTPNVQYQLSKPRFQLGLNAGTNLRYYGALHESMFTHSAGVGFTAQLARRTTLFANQGISYSPAYLYGLFAPVATPTPGDTIPGGADYATHSQPAMLYATVARLTQGIGRRDSLLFLYDAQFSHVPGGGVQNLPTLGYFDVGGKWTHPLTTEFGLGLGYTYRTAQYSETVRATEKDIDVGLNFNKPLSRSRRTTLAVNVGTAIDNAPIEGIDTAEVRQQYRLLVNAQLNHRLGRTWSLRGTYQRQAGFVAGFAVPVYANATTAKAEGSLNRRMTLMASGSATIGTSMVNTLLSQSNVSGIGYADFTTYAINTQLGITVTRGSVLHLEYLHYFYVVGQGIELIQGVSDQLNRNVFRASMTVNFPARRR